MLNERGAWDRAAAVARDTLNHLAPDSDQRPLLLGELGTLAEYRGDLRQAQTLYDAARSALQALAAAAPQNPDYRRGLSVAYGRLADLASGRGDVEGAEQLHRQALAIFEALAAAAPENLQYQRDLATSWERTAVLLSETAPHELSDWLDRALDTRRRLHNEVPADAELIEELAVTLRLKASVAENDVAERSEIKSLLEPLAAAHSLTQRGGELLNWAQATS